MKTRGLQFWSSPVSLKLIYLEEVGGLSTTITILSWLALSIEDWGSRWTTLQLQLPDNSQRLWTLQQGCSLYRWNGGPFTFCKDQGWCLQPSLWLYNILCNHRGRLSHFLRNAGYGRLSRYTFTWQGLNEILDLVWKVFDQHLQLCTWRTFCLPGWSCCC